MSVLLWVLIGAGAWIVLLLGLVALCRHAAAGDLALHEIHAELRGSRFGRAGGVSRERGDLPLAAGAPRRMARPLRSRSH